MKHQALRIYFYLSLNTHQSQFLKILQIFNQSEVPIKRPLCAFLSSRCFVETWTWYIEWIILSKTVLLYLQTLFCSISFLAEITGKLLLWGRRSIRLGRSPLSSMVSNKNIHDAWLEHRKLRAKTAVYNFKILTLHFDLPLTGSRLCTLIVRLLNRQRRGRIIKTETIDSQLSFYISHYRHTWCTDWRLGCHQETGNWGLGSGRFHLDSDSAECCCQWQDVHSDNVRF